MHNRREFIIKTGGLIISAGIFGSLSSCSDLIDEEMAINLPIGTPEGLFFKISLAEWSLHKSLWAGKMDHLDFAKTAREKYGINAIEYVNQFFFDKARDSSYLSKMKQRAMDQGVKSQLIMIDAEGSLATLNDTERLKAVENHYKWIEAAQFLECHSIRVNAFGKGDAKAVQNAFVDSLGRLCEYAEKSNINIIVENHGGYSSDADWLTDAIKKVNHQNCGVLPDLGNFTISMFPPKQYDRYEGVAKMMPFAKGVSAKSHSFNHLGQETKIDFKKILQIVKDSGFTRHIGIEYEGYRLSEEAGIKATKHLLIQSAGEIS
jgi:sugar phosphate isomerase/epimerase